MLALLVIVALLVLLDVGALALGSDTRDGEDWVRHAPR